MRYLYCNFLNLNKFCTVFVWFTMGISWLQQFWKVTYEWVSSEYMKKADLLVKYSFQNHLVIAVQWYFLQSRTAGCFFLDTEAQVWIKWSLLETSTEQKTKVIWQRPHRMREMFLYFTVSNVCFHSPFPYLIWALKSLHSEQNLDLLANRCAWRWSKHWKWCLNRSKMTRCIRYDFIVTWFFLTSRVAM